MQKQLQLIREFHEKFDDFLQDSPNADIPKAKKEFRKKIMKEELQELCEAMNEGDLVHIAHELVDLLYVTLGTAEVYGLSGKLEKVFDEIHRSNMSKEFVPGEKAVKGKNFQKADVRKFFKL